MIEDFEIGDIVRGKGGGPEMTVYSVRHGYIYCEWQGIGGVKVMPFGVSELTLIRKASAP